MGCDIHIAIECRTYAPEVYPDDWDFVCGIDEDRHYKLFGLMAGVRGDEQMFEPRGMPEHLCSYTEHYFHDFDGWDHTPSWLGADELFCVATRMMELDDQAKHTPLFGVVGVFVDHYGIDNVRVVFGFDS